MAKKKKSRKMVSKKSLKKFKVIVKDPICGMSVDKAKAKSKGLTTAKDGMNYYFCSSNCKDKFSAGWIKTNSISLLLSAVVVALAYYMYQAGYMLPFMGTVFLILAGLKLLDVKGFAKMFAQYDFIAKKSNTYAMAYPFIELALGLSFLFQWQVRVAAVVTVVVMSIGAAGVANNLLSKDKILCAKVPLTTFTLVEDVVMVVMGLMILFL